MSEKFEDLLENYKNIASQLSEEDIDLDRAINLYEKSDEIYKKLNKNIEDAKVRINKIRE